MGDSQQIIISMFILSPQDCMNFAISFIRFNTWMKKMMMKKMTNLLNQIRNKVKNGIIYGEAKTMATLLTIKSFCKTNNVVN